MEPESIRVKNLLIDKNVRSFMCHVFKGVSDHVPLRSLKIALDFLSHRQFNIIDDFLTFLTLVNKNNRWYLNSKYQ